MQISEHLQHLKDDSGTVDQSVAFSYPQHHSVTHSCDRYSHTLTITTSTAYQHYTSNYDFCRHIYATENSMLHNAFLSFLLHM